MHNNFHRIHNTLGNTWCFWIVTFSPYKTWLLRTGSSHGTCFDVKNLSCVGRGAGLTSSVRYPYGDLLLLEVQALWHVGKAFGVLLCSYIRNRYFLRWIEIIQIVKSRRNRPVWGGCTFIRNHYKTWNTQGCLCDQGIPRSPYVQLWLQEKQHDQNMAKTTELTIYNISKNQMFEWMVYLDLKIGDVCWGHPVGILGDLRTLCHHESWLKPKPATLKSVWELLTISINGFLDFISYCSADIYAKSYLFSMSHWVEVSWVQATWSQHQVLR